MQDTCQILFLYFCEKPSLLKVLFRKYASVLRFVVLFLGTYILLSVLYGVYLNLSKEGAYAPDFITNLVAKQSRSIIDGVGYQAEVIPHTSKPTMKLYINGKYLAHIIEGCNAVSIMILFVAFVISFAQHWKKTLLFILAGAVLIYAMNIVRIAILGVMLFEYPQYNKMLHGVVFPGIIYGMVFLLWMFWVSGLSSKKHRNE